MAYVQKILYNSASRFRRQAGSRLLRHTVGREIEVGPPEQGVSDRDEIDRLLRRLSAKQRIVLILRFYEDLSVEESAQVLGCSVGTVKSQTA